MASVELTLTRVLAWSSVPEAATPVPWQFSHWMPRPAADTLGSLMKSLTDLLSSRAHWRAVVLSMAAVAAGFGTTAVLVALGFGIVLPS